MGGNRPLIEFSKYVDNSKGEGLSLSMQRIDFWETSPSYSGRLEIWQMLHLAAESDYMTAQAILDSENISCPTGKLSDGCYDGNGNLYVVPIYCIGKINSPVAELEKEESRSLIMKGLSCTDLKDCDTFPLKIRLSSGTDIIVDVHDKTTIAKLKKMTAQNLQFSEDLTEKMKVIFYGKILSNSATIKESNVQQKSVLQIFI